MDRQIRQHNLLALLSRRCLCLCCPQLLHSQWQSSDWQETLPLKLDSIVSDEAKLCIGDIVNKHGVGREHDYLHIHSPDGAFSVI